MIEDAFLKSVSQIIGDRRKQYGSPIEIFNEVAKRWSITLGVEVSAANVAQCMIDLKQSRLRHDPSHIDSISDIVGYAAIYHEISAPHCRAELKKVTLRDSVVGLEWKDISIEFNSSETIIIRYGDRESAYSRLDIPGMFAALHTLRRPTQRWYFLLALASCGGVIGVRSLGVLFGVGNWQTIRAQKHELSKTLKYFFGLDDDPIFFDAKKNCYVAKFGVSYTSDRGSLERYLSNCQRLNRYDGHYPF